MVDSLKIPKMWTNSVAVCLGGGPSLNKEDIEYCREKKGVRFIAINDAYRLAPFADILYAADKKWWH